ncbi:hypothetical protein QUA82_26960 [Microcoleus sp. F8-D3]|uniref:Uncharacterized protein n=1 Tax=Phormidium nigroviride PCC 7112 TaxID=179408 RepID=K9VT94_9CYAN|nr:hypothetical protein [Oscillatoria nigro-viridis]AFZ10455.1 hypothetical protein Osc7112_6286 [Oscillatoria nigro-viridis PCC 7112]
MLLNTIQRFSPDYILRLKQIGLAFFEKIATDRAIAGETQDFYQGLLAGLDQAVKLIDEESGVQTLSLLEAKIATFIQEDGSSQQPLSSSSVEGDCKLSISRLPVRAISQLRQIGRETDCEPDIEECVCIGETQDFYHGCLAAIDFALSLAGEKYAYAQISLVKTNAANFIELNKDWERRVLDLKGLSSSKIQDRQPKQNLLVGLSQLDGDNQVGTLGSEGEGDEADSRSTEAGALAEIQEQDLKSDRSNSSELIVPLTLSNPALLKYQTESEEQVQEQFKEEIVKLLEEERLELENLLVSTLLDGCQLLKLGKRKVIEDWTAFLEEGEAIRVISDRDSHIVLRITLEGEVQSALSYGDAELLGATVKENSEDLAIFSNWLEPIIENLSADNLNADSVPPAAIMDIQQVKLAESILPTAQRVFEYLLNHAPDRVEETDEYTRVRVGDLYDLIVGESEGVSVSSLTVSVRGELIKVRGEKLVLAQGISPEDIDFWAVVAEQLDRIEARNRDLERSEPDSQSGLGG